MKLVRVQGWSKYFFILICGFLTVPIFRRSFYYISYPYLVLQKYSFNIADTIFDKLSSYDSLKQKLVSLEHDYNALLDHNIDKEAAIDARVIGRSFISTHYILVNKGFKDSVVKNMIAATNGKIIGKVVEVFRNHSKVILVSDPSMALVAETASGHEGVVQGEGKILRGRLNFVSHLLPVDINEPIFSTGEGLDYSDKLLVGFVRKVEKNGVHHDIEIKLAVDPLSIKNCSLLG